MKTFFSSSFPNQVDKALATVQRILDTTRSPRFAKDEEHSYEDKYEMAVLLTNTSIAALINALERLGMTQAHLKEMMDLVRDKNSTITLRFHLEHTCNFLKETVVNVDSDEQVSKFNLNGRERTFSQKVVKKVNEFHWLATYTYKILVYSGAEPCDSSMCFQTRTGSTTIITRTRLMPISLDAAGSPRDVNLTWLIQQLQNSECCFAIDRSDSNCKTPRRNNEIEAAREFWDSIATWTSLTSNQFADLIERRIRGVHDPVVADNALTPSIRTVSSVDVFVPVLPLMEASATGKDEVVKNDGLVHPMAVSSPDSPLLSLADVTKFLNEQCRSLDEAVNKLVASFSDDAQFVTSAEAKFMLYMGHIGDIQSMWSHGVDYIEGMLRDQLVAAIGKVVQPSDFDQFMTHHYRKIFASQYAPQPFCYAIRRPNHYPDGILSIENMKDDMDPIQTMVRGYSDVAMMQIPINAATTIDMDGPVYLHGWLSHRFASHGPRHFKLVGRARQFSSFLLMVGNMAGGDRFHPRDAIILQNKDEVTIPLLLNDIPSAKEFKDSISSLSPEQQRFATSFRAMQLESSVFGICVVQLKPQLEALLGLPEGALTKEIKLTQDLMSLFVEYQIPSDLLTYDGPDATPIREKVDSVKDNVKAVLDVIETTKIKELEEAKQKGLMKKRSSEGSVVQFSTSGVYRQALHSFDMQESAFPGIAIPMSAPASQFGAVGAFGGTHMAKLKFSDPQDNRTDDIGDWQKESLPEDQDKISIKELEEAKQKSLTKEHSSENIGYHCTAPRLRPDSAMARRLRVGAGREFGGQPRAMRKRADPQDDGTDDWQQESLPEDQDKISSVDSVGYSASESVDFTAMPKKLNHTLEQYDKDSAVRTTIIKTGDVWKRKRQQNILTKLEESELSDDDRRIEKNKAFDLLDAVSRSGSLPLLAAELHVVMGVTHSFEESVMETVIQKNMNPIEKMERSALIVAATIHNVSVPALVTGSDHSLRLEGEFPTLTRE